MSVTTRTDRPLCTAHDGPGAAADPGSAGPACTPQDGRS